jgi:UDP-N-acetyl-2-amino-2-deoxyglucuronate dehydrogenase
MGGTQEPLRSAVVGLRMGAHHARTMHRLPEYDLVAVCDLNQELVDKLASDLPGAKAYTSYEEMLALEKPDVVSVATPTASHAPLSILAAEAGVRGICCEKPMAISMGDGRAMVAACEQNGTRLIVGHQRRMGPDLIEMRRLMESGAIGEVYLLRGTCAGDLLSDGTHLIDSLRWLAGDQAVQWVLGQVYREAPDDAEERGAGYHTSGGYRYGHMVESGGMAVLEFESGLRAEMYTGRVRLPGRQYQDYEVFGTNGRLWRVGDQDPTPLRVWDEQAGGWRAVVGYLDDQQPDAFTHMYQAFARTIHEGTPHPLSGDSSLADLEVLTAIYESARTHDLIRLPLHQDALPLILMYG